MLMTVTRSSVDPSTTWWLVTISPVLVRIMPVPAARPPWYFRVEATRTRPVSWSSVAGLPLEDESNGVPPSPGPVNGVPPNGDSPDRPFGACPV